MISVNELAICLLIPGLLVWGSFFLRRAPTRHLQLPLALGVSLALFGLRWLADSPVGEDGWLWREGLTRAWDRVRSPKEARDWLIWLLPLAGLLAEVEERWVRRRWVSALWGVAVAGSLWRLLSGSIYLSQEWSGWEALLRIGGLGVGAALFIAFAGSRKDETALGACWARWLLTVVLLAGSVVMLTSGSQTFGLIGLSVAAAAGHSALAASMTKAGRQEDFTSGWWVFVGGVVIANGVFFAEVEWFHFGLLMVAIAIACWVRHRESWWLMGVGLLLSLGLSGAAGGLAVKTFMDQAQLEQADPYRSIYGD